MGIDAILPRVPEGHNVQKSGRMDCMKSGDKSLLDAESCPAGKETQSNTGFSELYEKVARCNKKASDETRKNTITDNELNNTVDVSEFCRNNDFFDHFQKMTDLSGNPVFDEFTTTENCDSQNSENMEMASGLIRNALNVISKQLDLPTCNPENFNLTIVTESTIEQFAEIIHVLKQIIAVLESSSLSGDTLDSGDSEIDPKEAADLASMLRIEQFKMEMGTQLLGVAADVQNAVALKAEQIVTLGIKQAVDPMAVTMPLDQIRKLFGDIIGSSENMDSSTNISKIGMIDIASGNVSSEQKKSSVQQFDTLTYRMLLKVDADSVQKENVSEIADKQPKLGALSESFIAQPINNSSVEPKLEFTGGPLAGPLQINLAQDTVLKTPAAMVLNTVYDDSEVVGQITSKFHTIAQSGSTEVRIHLRPESLGEVKLLIRVEGDIVVARIQVESQQVRQIVENNIQTLKDALAQQNFNMVSIDVNVGKDGMEGERAGWGDKQFHNEQSELGKKDSDGNLDSGSERQNRILTGIDTGGRYGTNSIEYFA